ncbi:MAG: hypothetical protein ACOYXC_10260 [Candidatus Rifleibacteriota bacterium]
MNNSKICVCAAIVFGFAALVLNPAHADKKKFKNPEMQGFKHFVAALYDAEAAHRAGDAEAEQQHLKMAAKMLEGLPTNTSNALIEQDFKGILIEDAFGRVHKNPSWRLEHIYHGLFDCTKGGLYEHLAEAIASHESRMPYYSEKTGGKSDAIFKKIASLQGLNLPIAWYIDAQARRFQKNGIPIIIGDLKSMATINPREKPPVFKGCMSPADFEEARRLIRTFQQQSIKALRKKDFDAVAAITYKTVNQIRAMEKKHGAHLAMTVHMLDSTGYCALHAAQYQKQTQGKTDNLARQFLTIHVLPMQECLPTDAKAQAIHQLGIGVVVNDVPDIPFLEEWQRLKRR